MNGKAHAKLDLARPKGANECQSQRSEGPYLRGR